MIDDTNKENKTLHLRINVKAIIVILLILSFAFNIFLLFQLNYIQTENTKQFRFINQISEIPLDSNNENIIIHYGNLREKIKNDTENIAYMENIGVFIQDIKTGAWLGINEKENFLPASLLKIPIMMAILKRVERGDLALTDKITLVEKDLDGGYGDLYKKGAGAQFTVWELLKEMILSSDNTAKNALKRYLSEAEINSIFAHVGIENPYTNETHSVSPRGFTRFFKALYYSTFLSAELSEKALDLTTDTKAEDLLSSGIPPEIQVAHKHGESIYGIHDCGIVYHPKNPYFICIMIRNITTYQDAKKIIFTISRDVFDFVNSK